jgi:hypothetical protein
MATKFIEENKKPPLVLPAKDVVVVNNLFEIF